MNEKIHSTAYFVIHRKNIKILADLHDLRFMKSSPLHMNKPHTWAGIQFWEGGIVLFVYFVLYILYALTLTINESAYTDLPFHDLLANYLGSQAIDYGLKGLLTIPIWYFFFRVIPHLDWKIKLAFHVLTWVVFVATWQFLFYKILESLGRGHLRGSSQIWDIYIPALIYIIQFGLFHAYDYHVRNIQLQKNEAELREANLASELAAIKAQLNPHFLYNAFNTISASVPVEMETTREMIAQLSDLFRYQLQASKEPWVSLREEWAFTEKYIGLEQMRMGNRLKTRFSIDPVVLDERVPSMLLQPVIENAIKHGLSPKIEGGTLEVSIQKKEGGIRVQIRDDGMGMPASMPKNKPGIGLMNTQLRLQKMSGETLVILPNTPTGVCIQFTLPTCKKS